MAIINALTDTWNNVATTFTAIKMTVTDTTSAAGSKLIDLLVGASSKFNVDKAGNTTIAGYLVTADGSVSAPAIRGADADSGIYFIGNNVRIACDGVLTYVHSAFYSYVTSRWGLRWSDNSSDPLGSSDVGIGRNDVGVLEINTGSSGTFRDIKLRNLLAGGGNGSYVQTPSMTVANLAAAATAGAGARAFVTDATATTFLSTVAGGGANKVPVVSDGANWLIG